MGYIMPCTECLYDPSDDRFFQYPAGSFQTDLREDCFKRLQKCTEDLSRIPDLRCDRRRDRGTGMLVWGEIHHPSNQPNAVLALQILSPTIFLSGILGVYRGYFQAYRNMMPTSISQILEQIFNAAVSLIAAWMFIKYFADGSDGSVAKWGAAGSTVGTTAGVVTALIFMLLVYGVNRRAIKRRVAGDHYHEEET